MKKIFESILDGIIGIASWDDGVDKFRFITYIVFLVVTFQIFKFILISNALFVPYFIFGLVFLVSTLSIVARRLTYLGMSFWYLILAIIPIINLLFSDPSNFFAIISNKSFKKLIKIFLIIFSTRQFKTGIHII